MGHCGHTPTNYTGADPGFFNRGGSEDVQRTSRKHSSESL